MEHSAIKTLTLSERQTKAIATFILVLKIGEIVAPKDICFHTEGNTVTSLVKITIILLIKDNNG